MTFQELKKIVACDNSIRVSIDSRSVGLGDVFVAIGGTNADGHNYITKAVENGAKYVVYDKQRSLPAFEGVQLIAVDDTAGCAGIIAQASCKEPAEKMSCLAVTGTNGKTTVAAMVRAVINSSGNRCGLIGTIENDVCDGKQQTASMTTPDAVSLAYMLKRMVENKAGFMCIEASSHSLDQKRLAGIKFKAAAFTNLTGDHLDYHKTMENYLRAKTRLFEDLPKSSTAVLNLDDDNSKKIAAACKSDILWYSFKNPQADIYADIEDLSAAGCRYGLVINGDKLDIQSSFCGYHNVSNQLAAAGLCLAAGIAPEKIAIGLSNFGNVPGRLERIYGRGDFAVFVDYAHTDDALENVLKTLKQLCKGRLITVFGCGGDRDKTKRPRMATVAQMYCDIVWVTSDNPRSEDPLAIIEDIKKGFKENTCEVCVEPDRKQAIQKAVDIAAKSDIILVAGKGHEDYQIIGNERFHFDDRQVVRDCFAQKGID